MVHEGDEEIEVVGPSPADRDHRGNVAVARRPPRVDSDP
jgi:hypothetical protein